MWAVLGRLCVAQAAAPARLIAVRPAAAGAFSIPHVTMATHFSKDQEERIKCVKGDLFSCPSTDALAHCISEDCRMGAGIAVLFKKKFGGVQELLDQKKKTGEVAVLQRDERYIYYLITKQKVSHKPTYESMQKSLEAMRAHCLNNGVTDISMPRIGCGLDGLQWEKVSAILEEVFENTDIKITVYTL
ncbi:OARD1 deacetylase, partial [Malurus elegans]|uniref:ADP-ribose glycohydrolase OARD1 n=3 Tax=Malurus TaxID=55806 RepID=A0A8C5UBM1_9PASS|nr:ADP-ribose glycohydrolase OARD1 isoform X1 [Malurus melanocephalus]NWV71186.1 OARD1 deacetylase [Malurus elegans]